jgi:hypothetical protein
MDSKVETIHSLVAFVVLKSVYLKQEAAMKLLLLLAVLLFPFSPNDGQGVLTVDTCRSDAKALNAEVRRPSAMDASYFLWSSRAEEMSRCQDIDPVIGNPESVQRGILYMGLENAARVEMIGELNDFIHRHGLQKQFVDDDDAGLR